MKIVYMHFTLSFIFLFLFSFLEGGAILFIMTMIIYFIDLFALFILLFIIENMLNFRPNISYPIAFILSIVVLFFFAHWFSGNSITRIFEGLFIKRNNYISIMDPYYLSGILAYLGLYNEKINGWYNED